MTGYIRKDTTNNIADGNVINATDLDNEFDGVQAAFVVATGHTHDGTASEGAAITKIGPVQDVVVSIAAMYPKITNTVDLGTSSLKYKDAFFAGNETVGGTLAVTGVATLTAQPVLSSLTASQAVFTDASKGLVSNAITGTGNVVMSTSPTLVTPILGTPASGVVTNLTGTASININGTVGATTANTGAFTTLTTTGTINLITVGRGAGAVATNTAVGASALAANTSGLANTALGYQAGQSITTGLSNTAIGYQANRVNIAGDQVTAVGSLSLSANTASANTAVGFASMNTNTSGANNTALGFYALYSNTTASNNTAVGYQAGYTSSTGNQNVFSGTQAGYGVTTATNSVFMGFQSGYSAFTGTNAIGIGVFALYSSTTAFDVVAIGRNTLFANTTGNSSIAIGTDTLRFNTSGSNNTAIGNNALYSNTTASNNTAVGYQAGYSNTTGNSNTTIGYQAGYSNSTGSRVTAVGINAARTNTVDDTTAFGYNALYANTTGSYNTGLGRSALPSNTTGNNNIAVGAESMNGNTTGSSNTALGTQALASNTTASNNTAVGYQAGYTNTVGERNTFVGYQAGYTSSSTGSGGNNQVSSTIIGYKAGYSLTTGRGNTLIGSEVGYSLTTGSANIFVGASVAGLVGAAGYLVTTGSNNVIIGNYDGSAAPISATGSNYIVLSDGAGNVRGTFDSAGNLGLGVVPSAWQNTSYKVFQLGFGSALVGQTDATNTNLGSNFYINSSYLYTYKNTEAASRYEQTVGQHRWFNAPSGTAGAAITFTQAMTLDTSGNLLVGTTVSPSGTGNIVPAAAKGVNFTGNTGAAGKTSQLLNWYEEGTWTPVQGAGLTVVGTFSSNGRYTRTGRLVLLEGKLSATTSITAAGAAAALCTGLPFACVAGAGSGQLAGPGSTMNGTATAVGAIYVQASTVANITALSATTDIFFSISYMAA